MPSPLFRSSRTSKRPPARWQLALASAAMLLAATVPAQSPIQPTGLEPGENYRILLVTDSTRNATSSNIADYDAFVTADVNNVPGLVALNTNWRAIASTPSRSARSHTGTNGGGGVPIYRPDGVRIADDYGDLWASSSGRQVPPVITASGATTPATRVWTGTALDGSGFDPLGDPGNRSVVGNPTRTTYGWVFSSSVAQANTYPLYGISDVLTFEVQHPEDLQPGDQYRVLLVTDSPRDATSSNIADYDAFVNADILANQIDYLRHLDTQWRAVASTPSTNARAHTETSGTGIPIYRPDRVRIADSYSHLWSPSQFQLATPVITASGATTSAPRVWTGTDLSGATFDPLGDSGGQSAAGNPTSTNYGWVWSVSHPQSNSYPLYAISAVISVPFPDEVGTGCGTATLTRDALPVIGGALDCTLANVGGNELGAVLVQIGVPTSGTPQPSPPFAAGCTSYLTNALTLGLTTQSQQQFSIAIPNDTAYINLPLTLQGATIDTVSGSVALTNAIAARVRGV